MKRNNPLSPKTLHVITGLSTGGAEMLLFNLLSHTRHDRANLLVVSLSDGGKLWERIESLGIPVCSLGMARGKFSFSALFRLFGIVRNFCPDIIHGWMYHANLFAMFAAISCKTKPLLIWGIFHCIEDLSAKKFSLRVIVKIGAYLSGRVDVIVNNSFKSMHQHEKIGYAVGRTKVIPNGIDTEAFRPDVEAYKNVRKELGLEIHSILVGLIGRFDPLKDHGNFLHACSQVKKKHGGVTFVLAGRGIEKKNRFLCDLIVRLGLENDVYLLGERTDVPRIMASLDISVSSSVSEGMPVAIGESMSCGVPCVVTDVGDSSILVGECGFIVPAKNSDLLAGAIITLLENDKLRSECGVCSRSRVMDSCSMSQFVSKFEDIYKL